MVRKSLFLALLVTGLATAAFARNSYRIERHTYRIDLAGHGVVLSKDQPVARGSVLLFHRLEDGLYTSVPVEEVVAITPSGRPRATLGTAMVVSAPVEPARPLRPGDTIVIGGTPAAAPVSSSDGTALKVPLAGAPSPSSDIADRLALDAQVFPGDIPAPAGAGSGSSGAPGAPLYGGGSVNPTFARGPAAATASTTVGPNGFPVTTTGPQSGTQPINPNGFPATTMTGPQSGVQPINPNGFPATTLTGPQSGVQPINPNGFPALNTQPVTATPQGAGTTMTVPAGTRGSTQTRAVTTSRASTAGRVGTTPANSPDVGVITTAPATASPAGASPAPAPAPAPAGTSANPGSASSPRG